MSKLSQRSGASKDSKESTSAYNIGIQASTDRSPKSSIMNACAISESVSIEKIRKNDNNIRIENSNELTYKIPINKRKHRISNS